MKFSIVIRISEELSKLSVILIVGVENIRKEGTKQSEGSMKPFSKNPAPRKNRTAMHRFSYTHWKGEK